MGRIDAYLARVDPTPEVANNVGKPEQPDDMTFNGLQRRLVRLAEMLDRLSMFCDKLERIA